MPLAQRSAGDPGLRAVPPVLLDKDATGCKWVSEKPVYRKPAKISLLLARGLLTSQ